MLYLDDVLFDSEIKIDMAKQGKKCGVMLPSGRCQNLASEDTGRCWQHRNYAPDNPSGRIDNKTRQRVQADFDNTSPIFNTKVNKMLEELRHEKNVRNVVHTDYGFTIHLQGAGKKSISVSHNDDGKDGYIVSHYDNGEEVKSQEVRNDDELVDHINDSVKSLDKDNNYRRRRRPRKRKKRGNSMMSRTIRRWLQKLRILPPMNV